MAETTDAFLHLVKRETQGKVRFPGVYKLRRLELRVPFVKRRLEEDGLKNHGRFDYLLKLIPDYDSGKTMESKWHCFVVSHLDKIKQEFQKLRDAKCNLETTGKAATVEATAEAAKVEATAEAAKMEAMKDSTEATMAEATEKEAMVEAMVQVVREGLLAALLPQRGAAKRPHDGDDDCFAGRIKRAMRQHEIPEALGAPRAMGSEQEALRQQVAQLSAKLEEASAEAGAALSKVVEVSAKVVKVSAELGAVSIELSSECFIDKVLDEFVDLSYDDGFGERGRSSYLSSSTHALADAV
ncbi:hypothetical protein AB1Y20_022745 [Prymnesium parvum]|uniref:Centrosomal protein of 19 kDa n=1 Tax=Prymnesium parvum TaxID=97485 RepID=A0AB34JI15_PRYPA